MKKKEKIVVNGRAYNLQHPGNREWLNLKGTLYSIAKGCMDVVPLLDYCFEHVVFPVEGKKLNLDDVDLTELEEVWTIVLPRFLRGELESGYIFPGDRKSQNNGRKLLQTEGDKD